MEAKPTVYAKLYDARTNELRSVTEARLSSEASKATSVAARWVSEAIREAYTRGIHDGFVQGVAAVEEDAK